MYLPVDFLTPLIFIAVAGILVLFGIPLGISALVRRKKFGTLADGLQTYARRRDLRIQSGISIGCFVLALAAAVTAVAGWNNSSKNLAANVETRYNVSNVTMLSWNGSWAVVDLIDSNGRPVNGVDVVLNDGSEPMLQGPEFIGKTSDDTITPLNLR